MCIFLFGSSFVCVVVILRCLLHEYFWEIWRLPYTGFFLKYFFTVTLECSVPIVFGGVRILLSVRAGVDLLVMFGVCVYSNVCFFLCGGELWDVDPLGPLLHWIIQNWQYY